MTKKIFAIFGVLSGAWLIFASGNLLAQSRLLSAVNYAEFRYDSTLTYVEIYTSISPAKLTFHEVRSENDNGAGRLVSVAKLKYEFRNLRTDSTFFVTDNIPIGISEPRAVGNRARIAVLNID